MSGATDPAPDVTPSARPASGVAGWKVATAAAAGLGLVLASTVYVLMDRQIDDLQDEVDDLRRQLGAADDPSPGDDPSGTDDQLGELGDLLGGLLGGDLGDLGDLLGGDLGDLDPALLQCLAPSDGIGLNLGGGSIPDAEIETQVKAVAAIIADERGLPETDDFDIEFVSSDEVQRRAVDLARDDLDPAEAAIGSRVLAALGAIEPGTDLVEAQLDALDAGVGGFYDTETGELVIGSESLDGMGAYITSHELVHAMVDAAFGLPDTRDLADRAGADAAYAALNAIEGDATLYGQKFIADHLPMDQLLGLQAESAATEAAMADLPHFVSRNLEFPYVEGMTFTCHAFLDGGWETVDDTYRTLPTTTAQILFPDRYLAGEDAVDVRQPAGPSGWELLDADTFGAADLLFLLEAPGDDASTALSDPVERVGAWAGGELSVWGEGEGSAVGLVLADRGGATPLCETVTDFYAAAFPAADASATGEETAFDGPSQAAVVRCVDDEVALGIGPDLATARAAID